MEISFIKRVLPSQRDFIESPYPFTALIGGYGSGKTQAGILKAVITKILDAENGVKDPTTAIYSLDHSLMNLVIVPEVLNILDKMGIKNRTDRQIGAIYTDQKHGKFILRSYTHPERIVSYSAHRSFLDELDVLPSQKAREVWEKILGRNRKAGIKNTVDVMTTPEGLKFVYDVFDGGNREKKESEGYKYFCAKTKDNPFISKDYVKTLEKTYDPKRVDAYLNGKFVNLTSGLVYYNYKKNCCVNVSPVNQNETINVGQDFNVGGCVSIISVVRDGIVYVLDEIISYDTQEVVIKILSKYGKKLKISNIIIYPDASGGSRSSNSSVTDLTILMMAGFTIYNNKKRNPPIRDRVNTVNFLFGSGKLKIDPQKCPKLHNALSRQGYDSKGEPEKFSGSATIDDFVDSLGYYVFNAHGAKLLEKRNKRNK